MGLDSSEEVVLSFEEIGVDSFEEDVFSFEETLASEDVFGLEEDVSFRLEVIVETVWFEFTKDDVLFWEDVLTLLSLLDEKVSLCDDGANDIAEETSSLVKLDGVWVIEEDELIFF